MGLTSRGSLVIYKMGRRGGLRTASASLARAEQVVTSSPSPYSGPPTVPLGPVYALHAPQSRQLPPLLIWMGGKKEYIVINLNEFNLNTYGVLTTRPAYHPATATTAAATTAAVTTAAVHHLLTTATHYLL